MHYYFIFFLAHLGDTFLLQNARTILSLFMNAHLSLRKDLHPFSGLYPPGKAHTVQDYVENTHLLAHLRSTHILVHRNSLIAFTCVTSGNKCNSQTAKAVFLA